MFAQKDLNKKKKKKKKLKSFVLFANFEAMDDLQQTSMLKQSAPLTRSHSMNSGHSFIAQLNNLSCQKFTDSNSGSGSIQAAADLMTGYDPFMNFFLKNTTHSHIRIFLPLVSRLQIGKQLIILSNIV